MLRRARGSGRLLALVVVCGALGARADDQPTFWQEMARPEAARYGGLVGRAAALLQVGNAPAAARLLDDAVTLEPREPLGFYLLGYARYQMRDFPRCADALTTVSRLAPGYAPALTRADGYPDEGVDDMLGLCLALGGRLDDAVAHYRRLLLGASGDLSLDVLHGNLGDCYQALGRLEEAIEEYQAALAVAPRRALLHAALAVAYDRDERVARAHEAMARALQIDPQLTELASPTVFYIPPADVHFYLGLGYLVASEFSPRRQEAIAQFSKYLDVAGPQSPWTARARLHLAELGPPALRARDVAVQPADAAEGPAIARALLAAGPELQACLEPAGRRIVVRASLAYHGHGKEPSAPPAVSLTSIGPDPAQPQVLDCLEKRLAIRSFAVQKVTRIQIAIGAP